MNRAGVIKGTIGGVIAALTIIVFASANLLHIRHLWGINLLGFYSSINSYLLISLVILILISPISKKVILLLERLNAIIRRNTNIRIIFYFIFIAAFFILSVLFKSATTFLGDGHLRTNQLTFDNWFLPTEFLDFILHAGLYNFIMKPIGYESVQTYQIFSSLCGVIFIIGIWKLSSHLFRESSVAAFLTIISSGVTVFFFGYIESYSLIAAILPFVFHSGLKAIDNSAYIKYFIILCITAVIIHSVAAFLLWPALIYVIVQGSTKYRLAMGKINKYMTFAGVAIIVAAYIVRAFWNTGIERYLLSILPSDSSPQAIFTIRHLLNIINWLCLAALPILAILPLAFKSGIKLDDSNKAKAHYAGWIIASSSIFIFFFVPQLGGPRDWDLYALPFFMILIASLAILSIRRGGQFPAIIISIVSVSLILTISLIAINSSIAKSTDRFAEIIEVCKFNNLFKEYNLLNSYAGDHSEMSDRQLEFALKAWEQPPLKKSDSSLILNKLGEYYMAHNKPAEAERYLNLSIQADRFNIFTYHFLTNYYSTYGTSADLLNLADAMAARFPTSAKAQTDAGVLYMQLGRAEKGQGCLTKAYTLDSSDVFVIVNYGVLFLQSQKYAEAVRLLQKAVNINPAYFKANYNLALAYAGLGDKAMALKHLQHAGRLAKSDSDTSQIKRLEYILNKR
ncbi:MAG: hypothetical protein CVT49_14285 [candidate division Zixibacteria bacterium HGW-Zixibacteria-1]|nr:MAG: hypothetical protein CVT49_14285 [candidate division Zixibacteria bacterium HGW-Zixibacteria-1]